MEDIVKSKFVATKESCMLTSLGYAMKYFANKQGASNVCVEDLFWKYIEYYRVSHQKNGLSGKEFVRWTKGKKFSKNRFPKESKTIEDKYKHEYNYTHIGKACAELLSTIMIHWVCQFENSSMNSGSGKRGYEEIVDFFAYLKNNNILENIDNIEIVAYDSNSNMNFKDKVCDFLRNNENVALILFPFNGDSHSVFIYKDGEEYIIRDPNKNTVEIFDLSRITIREYIILAPKN